MRRALLPIIAIICSASAAWAQVTPAAGVTPPDDTPAVRVAGVVYTDYTYQQDPEATDADGNTIRANAFNVGRAYINMTGQVSHLVSFRITPDISRETGTGSSLNGSLTFRIKYTFAQINFDDWMTRGSWARIGIQQLPWVDFEEGIYRYRFQGTVFTEREGFLSSSDAGVSFHTNFPSNYGDLHVGVYNGENYSRVEANDQKSLAFRGTVRPFATGAPVLHGLRAHVAYVGDNYVKNAERMRFIGAVTFEHTYLNAGFDYLDAKDQTSITKADIEGKGYSIWATPRSPQGWEALLRYDHLKPNTLFDSQVRNRTIVGVAYWFKTQGNVSSALLLDYDGQTFGNFTPAQPAQKKIALHAVVNF